MGVARIFAGGGYQGFFQNFFRGGPKVVKIFFPLETKKTTFFAEILKIKGGKAPLSDAHASLDCGRFGTSNGLFLLTLYSIITKQQRPCLV